MNQLFIANLALLVAMVSVQGGAALAHQLFPTLGAAGTACARVSLAAIILWVTWRPWRQPVPKAAMPLVAAYGAALGLMNLMFYGALTRIPLGIAVALEFVGPLTYTVLLTRKWSQLLWTVLAATGLILLLPLGAQTSHLDTGGIVLALSAGAAWAAYIAIGSRVSQSVPSGQASALGMAVAAVVVLPFGLTLNGSAMLHFELWPLAVLVALMSSALPYSLEMIALSRMSARSFGIFMSLGPVVGSLAGALMLHQQLTQPQIIAIACISLASIGSTASESASQTTKIPKNDLN